jgi:hypothetical protein
MLYAVSSTGGLTTGTNCPTSCDGCDEKWYLHLWRALSISVSYARRLASKGHNGPDDIEDWRVLREFEEWIDETIIPLLEDSYRLEDWNA